MSSNQPTERIDWSDADDAQVDDRSRYLETVRRVTRYKADAFADLGLTEGETVLDAGCGTGEDALSLADIVGSNGKVVGLDFHESSIEEANRHSRGSGYAVEFIHGDIYDIPFPANEFDASRADRVFQHLDEPERALRELMRVTKSGGRIQVGDPDWGTLIVDTDNGDILKRILAFRAEQSLQTPGDWWRGRQLRALFSQAGMQNPDVRPGAASITDYDLADYLLYISYSARTAYEGGAISAEELQTWESEMNERKASNRFFASMTGFGVTGINP